MAVFGKDTVGNKRSWEAAMTAAGEGVVYYPSNSHIARRYSTPRRTTECTSFSMKSVFPFSLPQARC